MDDTSLKNLNHTKTGGLLTIDKRQNEMLNLSTAAAQTGPPPKHVTFGRSDNKLNFVSMKTFGPKSVLDS